MPFYWLQIFSLGELMPLQLGIVGGFQNGKSTLINCLAENRIAISGDGLSTTKQVIKYFYAEKPEMHIYTDDQCRTIHFQHLDNLALPEEVTSCKIGVPCSLLKDVELWDTPGFNADDRDDKITLDCLGKLDCVIFLKGGISGGLTETEQFILRAIVAKHLPHIIVFNSQNSTDRQWIPHSEENRKLCENMAAVIKQQGICGTLKLTSDIVLSINTAWYWYKLRQKAKVKFFLPENKGEKVLHKKVSRFFYTYSDELDETRMTTYSNVGILKDFLAPESISFGKIYTRTAIYQKMDEIRQAFALNTGRE